MVVEMNSPHFVFRNEMTNEKWVIPIFSYPGDIDDLIEKACVECEKRNLEGNPEQNSYGVHDFYTSGEYELIGFTSYEIENEKYPELMDIWKSILIELGCVVGDPMVLQDDSRKF